MVPSVIMLRINGVRGVDILFIKVIQPLVLSVLWALLLASGNMALSKLKTLGTGLRRHDGIFQLHPYGSMTE